jgi:nitrate reductase NapD
MSALDPTPAMSTAREEVHIASLVVYATPRRCTSAAQAIRALPDARVHAVSEAGKIVVTLETPGAREMTACIDTIRRIAGVLSVALVYQCADTLDAMNEEMP